MDSELPQQLWTAIAAGDFERAEVIAQEYGGDVRARLQAETVVEVQREITGRAVNDLLRALAMARVARAHLQARFLTCASSARYLANDCAPNSWAVKG